MCFSPGKRFYGWRIVLAGFLSDFWITGVGTYTFGNFLAPMQSSLGWSRGLLSGAITVRLAVTGLLAPVVGPLLDRRHGARAAMALGGLLGGGGLLWLAWLREPWQYYLA
ncbi:MAG TPA: hypothetical protein VJM69_03475, partial [Dehalococcoidia bacterium]|nr:hypothetical protein [Dehalococcoidia bacterium]